MRLTVKGEAEAAAKRSRVAASIERVSIRREARTLDGHGKNKLRAKPEDV